MKLNVVQMVILSFMLIADGWMPNEIAAKDGWFFGILFTFFMMFFPLMFLGLILENQKK